MTLPCVRFTVRRVMVAVAVMALILGAGASLEWYWDPYITVKILNETGQPLHDVRVSWSGGARESERIGPGEVVTWRIKPYGLLDINLSYRNPDALEYKKHIDVSNDIGYSYSIDCHILINEIKTVADYAPYPARLPQTP